MSFIEDLVAAMVEGFVTGVVEALVEVWKEIEEWVSDLFTQLKRVWDDVIFEGQKTADGLARFDEKYYYQKSGKWHEQTTTREISADKVPAHIRNRLGKRETDITPEMKELTLSH